LQRCSRFEYRNRSCVSQFHIKFDDLFETVPLSKHNIHWQKRTGFVQSNEPEPTEPPIPDSFYLPPAAARPNNSGSTVHQKQTEIPDPTTPARQQELSVTSEQGFTASSEGASPTPLATSRRSVTWDPTLDDTPTTDTPQTPVEATPALRQVPPAVQAIPASATNTDDRSSTVHTNAAESEQVAATPTRTRTRTKHLPQRLIEEEDVAFIAQAWDCVWDIRILRFKKRCQIQLLLLQQRILE
jgi:hypothetical protein